MKRTSIAALLALSGLACGNKSAPESDGSYKDITRTFDNSEPPPAQRKPVEGANLEKLSEVDRGRFDKLVDSLQSPCGKAHSLRTSRNNDATCARARFAVDYVIELLGDGAGDDEVREMYAQRYASDKRRKGEFKLGNDVPHVGPTDARVVLVEFFDFGCPACQEFRPELEEAIGQFPADVVLYYKQFPLAAHPDSRGAAQAALAAHRQGKYLEYHKLLFDNPQAHKKDDLVNYARQLGLDMKKFEADYASVEKLVEADKAEGEAAKVSSTPTLFVDGGSYEGPQLAKYVKLWIEEELAVNR